MKSKTRLAHLAMPRVSRSLGLGRTILAAILLWPAMGMAEPVLIDDFKDTTGPWRFFTDQVMGGVSVGKAIIRNGSSRRYLELTGTVSTKNRGGFIQARRDLDTPFEADVTRIRLRVRGDGQTYFFHLRTTDTGLPWQYYQAAFTTTKEWSDVTLTFEDFKASGRMLPATPAPETITSIALVAYGRDHTANISLSQVEVD